MCACRLVQIDSGQYIQRRHIGGHMRHGIQTDAHTLELQLNALTAIWVLLQNCAQDKERDQKKRDKRKRMKKSVS